MSIFSQSKAKGGPPLAICHLSIKIISRGKDKSAVAAEAYRAGEKITNEHDGVIHDYTRKGGVAHTEILRPEYVPPEYADRSALWNAVEKIEKNKNSQLAREIEIALPVELSAGQNLFLVREYGKQQSRKATIDNLKAAVQCLNFLTDHGIKDMAGLSEYVAEQLPSFKPFSTQGRAFLRIASKPRRMHRRRPVLQSGKLES